MNQATRGLRAALLCACCFGGVAAAQEGGAHAGVTAETDADRFTTLRLRMAGLGAFTTSLQYAGIAVQETVYSQSGATHWNRRATAVMGLWRNQDRATLAGINIEAGATRLGNRLRPVGEATWGIRPGADTGVELLASAGLVETRAAIERGVGYAFYGVAVEQRIVTGLTAIALAAYQPFTDGNHRNHLRARLIWDALPDQGITLQARWRGYRSSQTGSEVAYFDPASYQQWLGVVGLRKRIDGWVTSGAIGAGREIIHSQNDIRQPAWLAELRVEKLLADGGVVSFSTNSSRAVGFSNAADYWFAAVGVNLTLPFR